jgi:hypothetical protein
MRWAKIQHTLQQKRKEALEAEGVTESELRELGAQVVEAMTEELYATEFGTVQRVVDRPVQWVTRRTPYGSDPFPGRRVVLLRKDEA